MTRLLAFAFLMAFCGVAQEAFQAAAQKAAGKAQYTVLPVSAVKWTQLNPLRGDRSPKAGALWGKRTGPGPAGFLLRPTDGFRSPPHIHNVAYRGIVIRGLLHNDDPKADNLWMPRGSFWTQPAGHIHVTACKGICLAYIEIEDAFGVLPPKKAFAAKDKPVNVHASNLVWIDASQLVWTRANGQDASSEGPQIAFLWGKPQSGELSGVLVRLPTAYSGTARSRGPSLRAIVIQGRTRHQVPGGTDAHILDPGSYFSSTGAAGHAISCRGPAECILYVRAKGRFNIMTAKTTR